jgi:hypothetical protein|tara:strand:- start:127 stop:714 length:588 start_codon:yes stop_codon:yes gene_type:complete
MKSDESVGAQDPDTGEAIPLKDLHFTKQQKWFSKCWKGELAFPRDGIMIAGLKLKTLSEMKAYFHSKYQEWKSLPLPLQEQEWHKEVAAQQKRKAGDDADALMRQRRKVGLTANAGGPSCAAGTSATRSSLTGGSTFSSLGSAVPAVDVSAGVSTFAEPAHISLSAEGDEEPACTSLSAEADDEADDEDQPSSPS